VRLCVFDDHHAYTTAEAAALAASVEADELPVCTLKDAVKLGPLWPRVAPPLWYVSQHVTVESGAGALNALFDTVLRARGRRSSDARPSQP
jgi:tetraacyldisaccharide 4'-kinase